MIRVVCPSCQAKFNAKDSLAGRKRKCPQCGGPLEIPQPETKTPTEPTGDTPPSATTPNSAADNISGDIDLSAPIGAASIHHDDFDPNATRLPTAKLPTRLERRNRYLIVNKTSVVANWQTGGRGWMLKIPSGFVSAKANRDDLPAFGTFVLVELAMTQTDDGLRLAELKCYKLANRYAMTKLDKGDHEILEAVTDLGCISREQKNAVRQIMPSLFMREVWGDAAEVLEFLANYDYHSPSSTASAKERSGEE
jgi:hypothetical protein